MATVELVRAGNVQNAGDAAQVEPNAPAALVRALERGLDRKSSDGTLAFRPQRGELRPFYGAHFDPVRATIGGVAYRVFVSAEEDRWGPPTQMDEAKVAVLQRLSDGHVSNDVSFVVPQAERERRPTGRVQYIEPNWW